MEDKDSPSPPRSDLGKTSGFILDISGWPLSTCVFPTIGGGKTLEDSPWSFMNPLSMHVMIVDPFLALSSMRH